MSEYKIRLEVFEGPMALLLHLIEKNQIDIYDIPIAEVTEQYLLYLRAMQNFNIEIASEFLVLAATLLQIKSRMLLPRPSKTEAAEEEIDPRQELVDRLLEYRKYKEAAQHLDTMRLGRDRYLGRKPQQFSVEIPLPAGLTLDDLLVAFTAVWESTADEFALVTREEVSVQDKMRDIIHLLRHNNGQLDFFQTIIRTNSRSEVVAAFIALLELIRLKRVTVCQEESFGPIFLKLRDGEAN